MIDLFDMKYQKFFKERHNFFIFKTKDKEVVSFNEVLPAVTDAIFEGKKFTDFFALGFSETRDEGADKLIIPAETTDCYSKGDECYVVKRGTVKRSMLSGKSVTHIGFTAGEGEKLCTHSVLPIPIDNNSEITAVFFMITQYNFLSYDSPFKECLLGVRSFDNAKLKAYKVYKDDLYGLNFQKELSCCLKRDGSKLLIETDAEGDVSGCDAVITYEDEKTARIPLSAETIVTLDTYENNGYFALPKNYSAVSLVKAGERECTDVFDGMFIIKDSARTVLSFPRLHKDSKLSSSLYGKYLFECYGKTARVYTSVSGRLVLYGVILTSNNINKLEYADGKFYCLTDKQTNRNTDVFIKGEGLYLEYQGLDFSPFKNKRLDDLFLSLSNGKIAAVWKEGGGQRYGYISQEGILTEITSAADRKAYNNTVFSECSDMLFTYGGGNENGFRLMRISAFEDLSLNGGVASKILKALNGNPTLVSFGSNLTFSYSNGYTVTVGLNGESLEYSFSKEPDITVLTERGAIVCEKNIAVLTTAGGGDDAAFKEICTFEAPLNITDAVLLNESAIVATNGYLYAVPFEDSFRRAASNLIGQSVVSKLKCKVYVNPETISKSKSVLEYTLFDGGG